MNNEFTPIPTKEENAWFNEYSFYVELEDEDGNSREEPVVHAANVETILAEAKRRAEMEILKEIMGYMEAVSDPNDTRYVDSYRQSWTVLKIYVRGALTRLELNK